MQFSDLKLSPPVLRALEIEGYEVATPIQAKAIPHVLEGRDLIGCAQTGTGKTAAFALPILCKLHRTPPADPTVRRVPRVLVLCPTRELATQIGHGFKAYGREVKARYSVIFGGVGQNPQIDSIRSGVDIIVACPGRLLDLMNQGRVDLSTIDTLVLDEADRMLDMGFIHDIRRIISKMPTNRQTLFFSATMPPEIRKLADTILRNPVTVAVAPVSATADRIDESVYFVGKTQKPELLAHLVRELPMYRAIVFSRTKHGADKIVKKLEVAGIKSAAIHGNKSQNNRNRALHAFKENKIGVLVATDIAARGIDIDGVTHVVNYDLTHEPETYVHRIGRTARAGASGNAISFCDRDERSNLNAIERLIKRKLPVVQNPLGDAPVGSADDDSGSESSQRPANNRRHGGPSGRPPRRDQPQREMKPHREPRGEREQRPDREQRPERQNGDSRRQESGHPQFRPSQPRRETAQSGDRRQSSAPRPSHGPAKQGHGLKKHGSGPNRPAGAGRPTGGAQHGDRRQAPGAAGRSSQAGDRPHRAGHQGASGKPTHGGNRPKHPMAGARGR